MDRFTDKVGVITDGRSGRGPAANFRRVAGAPYYTDRDRIRR
jgi:hypothetical protein